jgi:hypothetical protein
MNQVQSQSFHCLSDAHLYHDLNYPLWGSELTCADTKQLDEAESILLLGRDLRSVVSFQAREMDLSAFVRDAIHYPPQWQNKLKLLYASSMSEVLLASSLDMKLPIIRLGHNIETPLKCGPIQDVGLAMTDFDPLLHGAFLAAWKLIEKDGHHSKLSLFSSGRAFSPELHYWIKKLELSGVELYEAYHPVDLLVCLENDRQEGLMDRQLANHGRLITIARGRALDLFMVPDLPIFLTQAFTDQDQRVFLQVSKLYQCLQKVLSGGITKVSHFQASHFFLSTQKHLNGAVHLEAGSLKAQSFETELDFHPYPWDLRKMAGEYRSRDLFHRHFNEFCFASLNDLRQRVQRILGEDAYLLDDERLLALREYKKEEKADLVLFGGALFRLLESGSWPFQSMRIFVLSQVLKDFLISWFKFNSDEIGLLSRADLYPLKSENLKSSKGLQFVMASRLSRSKRGELVLAFVSYWQQYIDETATLTIFGRFDEYANSFDKDEHEEYASQFKQTLSSLPWKTPPFYLGDRHDWWTFPFVNPCYCNFSNFDQEDFSVSLSEALTQGWPCFLSTFGGLQDVKGRGIFHWPQELIANTDSLPEQAQALAHFLEKSMLEKKPELHTPATFYPQELSRERLAELRFQVFSQLGWSFHFLLKGMRSEFALTAQGQILINEYRSFMQGKHLKDISP